MSKSYRQKKKESNQEIATERIKELFSLADQIYLDDPTLSNRYVHLAHKISLKYKVPFSQKQKISFCKKCKYFLKAGENARIRLNKGKRVILCKNCGNIMRFRYK